MTTAQHPVSHDIIQLLKAILLGIDSPDHEPDIDFVRSMVMQALDKAKKDFDTLSVDLT